MATIAGFVAFSAYGGAAGFMTEKLSLGPEMDARLPFGSRRFSGAALGGIIGVPFTVLTVRAWRGDPRTGPTSTGAGLTLMAWILVQLAFLRRVSFLHPLFFVVGALFAFAGRWDPTVPTTAGPDDAD